MSGAVSIEISTTLLATLQSKVEELPQRFLDLINESGFLMQNAVKDEAPYITHNLQDYTFIENIGEFERLIYPDEGGAPYALYVILKGVKRNYAGNDYFDRAKPKGEEMIDKEIEQFEHWLSDFE